MSSLWLELTLLPIRWSRGCSEASRSLVIRGRFGHQIGIFLSFLGVSFGVLFSLLSWPLTNITPGKHPFCFLLCQSRGLVSCTASPFVFIILGGGDPAHLRFFLISLLRRKILLCLTLVLMSSWSSPWMTLWTVTEMNSCFAPSEFLRSIFIGWSSIVLISRVSSCPLVWERRGCLTTPFLSSCDLSFRLRIHQSPRRTLVIYGSGLMKSGRSLLPCCLRGTTKSIRYWRRGLGLPSWPTPPSTWEMSPTGT